MARSAKIATDSRRTGQDDIEGRNLHRASIFRSIHACAIPGDREPEVSTLKNANDRVLPSRDACFLRFVLGIFVEILSFFFFLSSLALVLIDSTSYDTRRIIVVERPFDLRLWFVNLRSWTCLESLFPYTSYKIFSLGLTRDAERLWFTYIYVYIYSFLWFFCWIRDPRTIKSAPSCRETMKKTIIIIGVLGEKGENYSITEVYLEKQGR